VAQARNSKTATGRCLASAKPVICVVAGALFDGGASAGSQRVLIAERPAGKHMAGRWEFPGGKVSAGETEADALVRELREELGVTVSACRPFMRLSHEYDDRIVELSMWLVESFAGEPVGLDGQGLKWVLLDALGQEDILEADAPFVAALRERSAPRASGTS
jgi:8-oxo-dGTP diphosphatase